MNKLIIRSCSWPRCQYVANIFKQKRDPCCGWNKEISACNIGIFKDLKKWKCCNDTGKFICNCPIVNKLKEEIINK